MHSHRISAGCMHFALCNDDDHIWLSHEMLIALLPRTLPACVELLTKLSL